MVSLDQVVCSVVSEHKIRLVQTLRLEAFSDKDLEGIQHTVHQLQGKQIQELPCWKHVVSAIVGLRHGFLCRRIYLVAEII